MQRGRQALRRRRCSSAWRRSWPPTSRSPSTRSPPRSRSPATRVLIWMGNVFALLGLRALFVLVEGLIRRFRYLDETIAIVLALVAVKLLIEDLYKIGPVASLAIVAACFTVGIVASLIADARDPDAEAQAAPSASGQRGRRARAGAAEPSRPSHSSRRPGRRLELVLVLVVLVVDSSSSRCRGEARTWKPRAARRARARRSGPRRRRAPSRRPRTPPSKISASSWAESSTTIRTSVWGLK